MENNLKTLPSFQLLVLITTPKLADRAANLFINAQQPNQ